MSGLSRPPAIRASNPVPDYLSPDVGHEQKRRRFRHGQRRKNFQGFESRIHLGWMSATPPRHVIPGQRGRKFNIRFNDLHSQEFSLRIC